MKRHGSIGPQSDAAQFHPPISTSSMPQAHPQSSEPDANLSNRSPHKEPRCHRKNRLLPMRAAIEACGLSALRRSSVTHQTAGSPRPRSLSIRRDSHLQQSDGQHRGLEGPRVFHDASTKIDDILFRSRQTILIKGSYIVRTDIDCYFQSRQHLCEPVFHPIA